MSKLHKSVSLWLLFAVSFAGYLLLWAWMPLRSFHNQNPLPDVRAFSPSLGGGLLYTALILALFACLWWIYQQVQTGKALTLPAILSGTLLLSLPLLLTFPINATDIYRYVIRGRISSVYGLNPFNVAPSAVQAGDPFAALAGEWVGATSPYGPLWELVATAVTAVSQDNLLLGLLLFKGLSLLTHLGLTAALWYGLADRDTNERTGMALLWAWNPALLLMFVVDAHNDALMLLWLLTGWLLMRRGRHAAGFLLMVLGPLTKPVGLLALPFFWLAALRQKPTWADRLRFGGATAVGSLLLVFLAFLPFGSPLDLVQRLLAEASQGASFSPATLLILLAQSANVPLSFGLIVNVALGLFLALLLWLMWLTLNGRSPLETAAVAFLGYVWQALNYRIWYSTWPFIFWLLAPANKKPPTYVQRSGLLFLLTSQLSVVIYGHLFFYVLNSNPLAAHALGVPFVFGLPWLVGWWWERQSAV